MDENDFFAKLGVAQRLLLIIVLVACLPFIPWAVVQMVVAVLATICITSFFNLGSLRTVLVLSVAAFFIYKSL